MRISDWSSDVCSSDLLPRIAGQVWQESPVINPDTRQGTVRIALPYSAALRPGGFADARIVAGTGQAPLLPARAVQSGPEGNFVLIVDRSNKVQRATVKVGNITDGGVAAETGMTGTERGGGEWGGAV